MDKYDFKNLLNKIMIYEEMLQSPISKGFEDLIRLKIEELKNQRDKYLAENKGVVW